jgi:ATP-dependent protease ClpP protease subunit
MEKVLVPIPEIANHQLPDASLLQFYKDLEDRIYWVDDEINTFSYDLVQYILRWNKEDKGMPIEERKPIKLIFCSPGGDLDVEEAIVSVINLSKTPIWGIAISCVASAASVIYLSCHKKFALPNAYWILHRGSCTMNGTYDQVMAAMQDYAIQVEKMMDFYCTHTTFSKEEIEDNINTDWYVRLETAIEKGMVDEVVTDLDLFL